MAAFRTPFLLLLLALTAAGLVSAAPTPVVLPAAVVAECRDGGCGSEPTACTPGPASEMRCCFCVPFVALPAEVALVVDWPARLPVEGLRNVTAETSRERPPLPPPKD